MYYSNHEIDRGRRIAKFLIAAANILSWLNLFIGIFIERRVDIRSSFKEIIIVLFIAITTISYYKGSRLAFRVMKFIMEMVVLFLILIPILALNALLISMGLLNYGGGILALIVPMVLIVLALLVIYKSKLYNDFLAYIDYQSNLKR